MNIFVLDEHPVHAAQMQCNKHNPKMLVESVQLLCTALFLKGTARESLPYAPTHVHHPCVKWLVENDANVAWLAVHTKAIADEYTLRFGKTHKSSLAYDSMLPLLESYLKLDFNKHTPFAQAMPEHLRDSDPVVAYRRYYVEAKAKFAKWAPRAHAPHWWPYPEH